LTVLEASDNTFISNERIDDNESRIAPQKHNDNTILQTLFVEQFAILYYLKEIQNCYSENTNYTSSVFFRGARYCSTFLGAIVLNNPNADNKLFLNIESLSIADMAMPPPSSSSFPFGFDRAAPSARSLNRRQTIQGCAMWLAFWKENLIWKYVEMAFMSKEICASDNLILHPRTFLGSTPYDKCFLQEYFSYPYNAGAMSFSHPRCNGFYSVRRNAVELRLTEIENMGSHEIYFTVVNFFNSSADGKEKTHCTLDVPQLACLCLAIGGRRLKSILKGLLEFQEVNLILF
jgi:hypothetical protein